MKKTSWMVCGSLVLVSHLASASVQCSLRLRTLVEDQRVRYYFGPQQQGELDINGKVFDVQCRSTAENVVNCVTDFAVYPNNQAVSFQAFFQLDPNAAALNFHQYSDQIANGPFRNRAIVTAELFNQGAPFTHGVEVNGEVRVDLTCSRQN